MSLMTDRVFVLLNKLVTRVQLIQPKCSYFINYQRLNLFSLLLLKYTELPNVAL